MNGTKKWKKVGFTLFLAVLAGIDFLPSVLLVLRLKMCPKVNGYIYEGCLCLKRTLISDGAKHSQFSVTLPWKNIFIWNKQKIVVFYSPFSLFFKEYFIDYAITVFPISPPLSPLCLVPQNPPALSPLCSCPWVVHTSYLSSLFLNHFWSLPVYFMPTKYASYSLYVSHSILPLPLYSSPPPPHWNLSVWSSSLWFCSCSSCLLSFCSCCWSFLFIILNVKGTYLRKRSKIWTVKSQQTHSYQQMNSLFLFETFPWGYLFPGFCGRFGGAI